MFQPLDLGDWLWFQDLVADQEAIHLQLLALEDQAVRQGAFQLLALGHQGGLHL